MSKDMLKGKKILIVDDERDILETLMELLEDCNIDAAPDYETALKFLEKESYDAAILDIMGVRGYDLLKITKEKGIPTLMLTAHALNPENLVRSLKEGAEAYVPKDKIYEIEIYLEEIIEAKQKGKGRSVKWYKRLRPFFDKKFGGSWQEKDQEFWKDFHETFMTKKEEVEEVL